MIKRMAARRLRPPWYLWSVGCRSGPRVDAAAIIEVSASEHVHHPEAATRIVPRRSSESHVSTWFILLWGMALLGLVLLPANYRAGAESAHAHSLIQLWVDAANGAIRHHLEHGMVHPDPGESSSWFDPFVSDSGTISSVGVDDERPDVVAQQESTPMSSGINLLLAAMLALIALGVCKAPPAVPDRRQSGLPPRILVPPPRWTPVAT